jgi:hypothetical protein
MRIAFVGFPGFHRWGGSCIEYREGRMRIGAMARNLSPRRATWILLILLMPLHARGEDQYIVLNILPELQQVDSAFAQVRRLKAAQDTSGFGVGIGGIFSYLNESRDSCRAHLLHFLALAERYDMPVVVQLDGEQWWKTRPDLWNWWDPREPGYDPRNAYNVEWSGWGLEHALKIAWRNWGTQIRVLPPPNLMSSRYREACREEMRTLVPLVLTWWRGLPERQKKLLLGIKLGWESSIGVNAYYYPDGNSLSGRPESEDPHVEIKGERIPDRGMDTIGYAAVLTAGLADAGPIKEDHLAWIAHRHLEDLCGLACELGVPRERLFTHIGGWKDEELLYDAAVNTYSCPGWSFYRYAYAPSMDKGVKRALRKSDAPWWAAVEWMLQDSTSEESWRNGINSTLSDSTCRYMCVYNWEGIKDTPGAVSAIRWILDTPKRER